MGDKQMATRESASQYSQSIETQIKDELAHFPKIALAVLFSYVTV
jgi:hypothetical protein